MIENDGYCKSGHCHGLLELIQDGTIQTWACHDCKKVYYRSYLSRFITESFNEISQKVLKYVE